MGEKVYEIFVVTDGKRLIARPGLGCKNNNKMDFIATGRDNVNYICSAPDIKVLEGSQLEKKRTYSKKVGGIF